MIRAIIVLVALFSTQQALSAQQDIMQISGVQSSIGALKTQVNTRLDAAQNNFNDLYTNKVATSCFGSSAALAACFPELTLGGGAALPSWMPSVGPTNGRQILQAAGGCSLSAYDNHADCETNSGTWTTPTYQHTSIISGLINDTGTAADDLLSAFEIGARIAAAAATKQNALGFTPENTAQKGAANGYAGLDSNGKVPPAQLPTLGTSQSATSLQMTFVSDDSLETQTGSKTKVPTGVDFTTADIGCDVSDSITFTLSKSSTVNGTYSAVGTISVSAAAQNESIDISSWANLTAGDWVRIDLTTAGTTAKECTVVIGGTEL